MTAVCFLQSALRVVGLEQKPKMGMRNTQYISFKICP